MCSKLFFLHGCLQYTSSNSFRMCLCLHSRRISVVSRSIHSAPMCPCSFPVACRGICGLCLGDFTLRLRGRTLSDALFCPLGLHQARARFCYRWNHWTLDDSVDAAEATVHIRNILIGVAVHATVVVGAIAIVTWAAGWLVELLLDRSRRLDRRKLNRGVRGRGGLLLCLIGRAFGDRHALELRFRVFVRAWCSWQD